MVGEKYSTAITDAAHGLPFLIPVLDDRLDLEELLLLAGITRGPGAAPITIGKPVDLGTDKIEGVANPDLSRAAPAVNASGQSSAAAGPGPV